MQLNGVAEPGSASVMELATKNVLALEELTEAEAGSVPFSATKLNVMDKRRFPTSARMLPSSKAALAVKALKRWEVQAVA
jgi:hypothetical protein